MRSAIQDLPLEVRKVVGFDLSRFLKIKKEKTMTERVNVEISSGNVFADIGIPEPEQTLAKAKLANSICELINEGHLTQQEAAKILGLDRSEISDIIRGKLDGFSCDSLSLFINTLRQTLRERLVLNI